MHGGLQEKPLGDSGDRHFQNCRFACELGKKSCHRQSSICSSGAGSGKGKHWQSSFTGMAVSGKGFRFNDKDSLIILLCITSDIAQWCHGGSNNLCTLSYAYLKRQARLHMLMSQYKHLYITQWYLEFMLHPNLKEKGEATV